MTVRWITGFLDRPAGGVEDAVRFWRRVTDTTLSPARGERGEFATFLPDGADACLRVQTVLDGPGGTHLDLHVDDVEAAVARAVALGSTAQPQDGYVSLLSPSGVRWCLVHDRQDGYRRPAPVVRADGHAALVDQLCLDLPPHGYDAECAFWQEVTGWTLHAGSRPEFRYLERPAGMPLRLLLQRLDGAPGDERAGAHPDLACTDVAAEVALHESWGAQVRARFPRWTAMVDPAGLPYCVTARDPVTGSLPS